MGLSLSLDEDPEPLTGADAPTTHAIGQTVEVNFRATDEPPSHGGSSPLTTAHESQSETTSPLARRSAPRREAPSPMPSATLTNDLQMSLEQSWEDMSIPATSTRRSGICLSATEPNSSRPQRNETMEQVTNSLRRVTRAALRLLLSAVGRRWIKYDSPQGAAIDVLVAPPTEPKPDARQER